MFSLGFESLVARVRFDGVCKRKGKERRAQVSPTPTFNNHHFTFAVKKKEGSAAAVYFSKILLQYNIKVSFIVLNLFLLLNSSFSANCE